MTRDRLRAPPLTARSAHPTSDPPPATNVGNSSPRSEGNETEAQTDDRRLSLLARALSLSQGIAAAARLLDSPYIGDKPAVGGYIAETAKMLEQTLAALVAEFLRNGEDSTKG